MDTQYRRILLPLDGSDVARSAVPAAIGIGRLFDSELTLLTVLNDRARLPKPVASGRSTETQDNTGDLRPNATSYLEGVAQEIRQVGVHTACAAAVNQDSATEIVLTARDRRVQLVVMASRGRSGLVRGLLGSVTDRVIHSSPIPVMVVPAVGAHTADGWSLDAVIAPLDGSELAETALPHVESISNAANVPILLVRAVPFPMTYGGDPYGGLPTSLVASAELDEKEAKHYLSQIATRLRARGHTVETHVGSGHPRSEINELAQETRRGMVVMTTRGASGLTRWVLGSVADSVIRSAGVPVLVVPPTIGR